MTQWFGDSVTQWPSDLVTWWLSDSVTTCEKVSKDSKIKINVFFFFICQNQKPWKNKKFNNKKPKNLKILQLLAAFSYFGYFWLLIAAFCYFWLFFLRPIAASDRFSVLFDFIYLFGQLPIYLDLKCYIWMVSSWSEGFLLLLVK